MTLEFAGLTVKRGLLGDQTSARGSVQRQTLK